MAQIDPEPAMEKMVSTQHSQTQPFRFLQTNDYKETQSAVYAPKTRFELDSSRAQQTYIDS